MTRHRWICPRCGNGKLGSSRPRKTATIRYCLSCSDESGHLVERTCPAVQRQREAQEQVRRKRQQSQQRKTSEKREREKRKKQERETFRRRVRERNRLRRQVQRVECFDGDLHAELARIWPIVRRLSSKDLPETLPTLTVARREHGYTTGRAWPGELRIVCTVGPVDTAEAYGLLAHEATHLGCSADVHHDRPFWDLLARIVQEAYDAPVTIGDLMVEPTASARQYAVEHAIRLARQRKGL